MKKLLTVGALAILATSVFGQGQVNFVNIDKTVTPNILAIVTDNGTPISGTAARAALLGGPAATGVGYALNFTTGAVTPGNLSTLANPNDGSTYVNFRTGAAAGYVAAAPRILTDVGYNSSAMLQMVVWTGNFNDWASALNAAKTDGSIKVGASSTWTVTTTLSATDVNLAKNIGLNPFAVGVIAVPEPSTMALAGLGAAALLIFRRRK